MTSIDQFSFHRKRSGYVRRLGKLLASPFYDWHQSGQMQSILKAKAVDKDGQPIPMLTYPANDFLQTLDLSQADILEFGCGQSTRWFSTRAATVTGLEANEQFRQLLQQELQHCPNVTIHDNLQPFKATGRYDIILVDGKPRIEGALYAMTVLKDDGIIILDNSDVASIQEISIALHKAGFARVDFFGNSPTGLRKQGTSIFFKSLKWFRGNPTVAPISKNSHTEKLS